MGAILDLVRVLFSPSEVYGRVKEAPKILLPLLAVLVVQVLIAVLSLPYVRAGMRAQAAAQPGAQQFGPGAETAASIAAVVTGPLFVILLLLVAAFLLWVIVSVLGGDAQFKTLFSVYLYSWVPALLLQLAGVVVLMLKGPEGITSMQDLQPSLGLDLFLAPMMELGAFMTALLRSVNPFSIWQIVLVAIGVRVTHNVEKGTATSAAIVQWLILSVLGAGLAALGAGARGG